MNNKATVLDPVTVEVIANALRSIADETYIALMKSAYSTNIKERHDHSACLMDAKGRLIVQAQRTQSVHLTSMLGSVRTILDTYEVGDLQEGDIFMSNDPYAALGSHLPDVNISMPVFVGGQLIGFSCNIAHHADVGGMSPGSMSAAMREIYQEGLRMPLVRLFASGVLNEDLFRLILLNVRLPEERKGDYMAQVAACRLGSRRLGELTKKYGESLIVSAFDEIIRRTEMRFRRAIAEIPSGVYSFEDYMDDDGAGGPEVPIRLKVTIDGDHIDFDFTGTSPQVAGNFNCPLNATLSAVCYTLKALIDNELPNNQGMIDSVSVRAESGSFLNPTFPAAVAYRAHTTQRVVDVVMGALAQAIPHRVLAASNGSNTTAIFSGTDPRSGRPYLYLETLGGGCGARAFKDGKDGVQQHAANTANLPVEAIESEYPLLVEEYSLVPDTGGAGTYRGGLALRRTIRPRDHICEFTGAGERFVKAPWGLFGGGEGAKGRFAVVDRAGNEQGLSSKPHPLKIAPDQLLLIQSPGAGGYGPPSSRAESAIARDWLSGKFSATYMSSWYGQTEIHSHALEAAANGLDYD
jgi:N-methylhydantoinase B